MDQQRLLAERFETHRARLRGVAFRMLGSPTEADDAVQEAWIRISRTDESEIDNLGAWLTTVVARVCLNMLRARKARHEEFPPGRVPEPIIDRPGGMDPEHEALLGDSVGLALLVLLETLAPAERVAFVLHDVFALPFEEIAPIVGRTPTATRQLASRARRRVRGVAPPPDRDVRAQRTVVDAFITAVRGGDFEGLIAVLDPDVVLRADGGARWLGATREIRGAKMVARSALTITRRLTGFDVQHALVNGSAGIVSRDENGEPFSVMGFMVRGGRILEIDVLADPERLRRLDLTRLGRRSGDGPDPGSRPVPEHLAAALLLVEVGRSPKSDRATSGCNGWSGSWRSTARTSWDGVRVTRVPGTERRATRQPSPSRGRDRGHWPPADPSQG